VTHGSPAAIHAPAGLPSGPAVAARAAGALRHSRMLPCWHCIVHRVAHVRRTKRATASIADAVGPPAPGGRPALRSHERLPQAVSCCHGEGRRAELRYRLRRGVAHGLNPPRPTRVPSPAGPAATCSEPRKRDRRTTAGVHAVCRAAHRSSRARAALVPRSTPPKWCAQALDGMLRRLVCRWPLQAGSSSQSGRLPTPRPRCG
jgi:hypothetical protein